jgi:hypothetical protein
LYSAWGRLIKRPQALFSVVKALLIDSFTENDTFSSKPRRKRARKTIQLLQFDVYQDENFRADSPKYFGSKSSTTSIIKRQTKKI